MSLKSPSTVLVEFAQSFVANASGSAIESGAEILDSGWQRIETDKGIVVSNAEWDFAPSAESVEKFYDALVIVGFYWRIEGTDLTERAEARDNCFALSQAFANALFNDQTLGDRLCDVLIGRLVDGMNNSTSDTYAIINLPLILNPTGAVDFNLGEAK